MADVRSTMEPLELLDLTKRRTVGEIVDGMSRCSFGARMLGEVAETVTHWVEHEAVRSFIVFDGTPETRISRLLIRMVDRHWFRCVVPPEALLGKEVPNDANLLVVGGFSERQAEQIFAHPGRTVFINSVGLAKPSQIRDGCFPDAVFADPNFVLPVLKRVIEERQMGGGISAVRLIDDLSHYNGLAHEVAHAAETLDRMVRDPDYTVFLTMSGAMTVAKMGLVICDLIDRGMVQAVASTGALMAHGLVESIGLRHYKYRPEHTDAVLAEQRINRVTDTLEPEENFTHVADVISAALALVNGDDLVSPTEFNRLVGAHLAERYPGERGILKSAFERDVPIFIPAFVDSEIGNDVFTENLVRERNGRRRIVMDLERDSRRLVEMMCAATKLGIVSIGGGVPRNNMQNGAPLIEIANERLGEEVFRPCRYASGCRIAPDPMWIGHLSGCTYSENTSWRKMDPNGRFSEVHTDATLALPFLAAYLLDRKS